MPTTICVKTKGASAGGCKGGFPESCQAYFEQVGASLSDVNCTSWKEYCKQTNKCNSDSQMTCEELGCKNWESP